MLSQLDPRTNLIFMCIQTLDCMFASEWARLGRKGDQGRNPFLPGPSAPTFQLTRGSKHITTVASGNQLLPAFTRCLQETSEVFIRLQPLSISQYQPQLPLRTTVAQILPDAQFSTLLLYSVYAQQHTM